MCRSPRRDETLRLEYDNHAAVFIMLEETLPFLTTLEKSPCHESSFIEVFICRAEEAWSEKASRQTRRCQSLAVPARLQWQLFQNPKLGILSFLSAFLSPDVYGSLREGINICTQTDEWLNLDSGCTEWDNRQSLQKALRWKRDNLQASSSLVRRSNCMTGVERRTDVRKKSTGVWQLMGCNTLLLC